ncbi:MAG TPA: N-acetylmuramoyl-L-alanine amidase, partial [Chthoniobacterales bacterium]
MFRRGQRDRAKGHPILAALGLALMIGSFTWLQFSLEKVPSSKIGATPAATQEPFALVVIDPGHGGDDSGTIKAGILEKELTLDVAHRAERLLQLRGLTTVLTRADDSYISLTDRVAIANGR